MNAMIPAAPNQSGPRQWGIRALVTVAIASAVFALWRTVFTADPVEVRVVTASRGTIDSTVTNSKAGTVRARQRSQLSTEIGGRVVEITHREGDIVAKGELLVLLNDSSLRAQESQAIEAIRAADAQRKEMCINRDRARLEYQRKQQLAAENIVSEDQLEQLDHSYQAAQAACKAADADRDKVRAALAGAAADLDKVSIHAPFNGVIAEVSAEVGEWVTPSPAGIIDLINQKSLYISAPMDEVDSGRIRLGFRAKVTVDSRPGEEFPGVVTRIAPYVLDVETQNRTVEIEVEIDDAQISSSLLPGTSADVEIILLTLSDVLRIPTNALFQNDRVLVIEDDILVERTVETGLRNWDDVEIRNGLRDGERVVSSLDRREVEAGRRVTITPADNGS